MTDVTSLSLSLSQRLTLIGEGKKLYIYVCLRVDLLAKNVYNIEVKLKV